MTSPYKKKIQPGFININFPITRGAASALSSTSDVSRAAKNNLIALLSTRIGERMFSDFGTNLQSFVFDPSDSVLQIDIEDEIKNAVNKWLPYLTIVEAKMMLSNISDRSFRLFVKFQLTENQYEDSLELIV